MILTFVQSYSIGKEQQGWFIDFRDFIQPVPQTIGADVGITWSAFGIVSHRYHITRPAAVREIHLECIIHFIARPSVFIQISGNGSGGTSVYGLVLNGYRNCDLGLRITE